MPLSGPGILSLGSRKPGLTVFKTSSTAVPKTIAGLAAWYDATKITPVADGTAIATWTDSSGGTGRDATQATGSKQPLYKTARQNGLPTVLFDGVDDYLRTATFTFDQPATVYVVCRYNTTRVSFDTIFDGFTADTGRLVRNTDNANMSIYQGTFSPNYSTTPQSFHIYTCTLNGNLTKLNVDNGTASGVDTSGGSPKSYAGLTLGSKGGGVSAQCANADVGELVAYTGSHSTANQNTVCAYLKAKWATP